MSGLDAYAEAAGRVRKLYQLCAPVIQEHGLPASPELPLVLRLLDTPAGRNAAELEYYTGSRNVSYITTRLRKRGLVAERRVPTDKRLIYLTLTERGRFILGEMAAAVAS